MPPENQPIEYQHQSLKKSFANKALNTAGDIFVDRHWTLTEQKEFFSYDPLMNKDSRLYLD